jgi:hypothetical protein
VHAFFYTVWQFSCVLAAAILTGYGVVRLLLPDEFRSHRLIAALPVSYSVLSGLAFVISGSFRVAAARATVIAFSIMAAVSVGAWFCARPRDSWSALRGGLWKVLLLSAPMVIVVLWPLFYIGAETYLGAVNPDYFASFRDNYLLRTASVFDFSRPPDNTYAPFTSAGSITPSARFGAALYGLLLEQLFGWEPRNALTLAIALFLFCLPLSLYFFVRAALNQEETVARLSAFLIGISGPITMSFIYFYIGQNSGLGITPLILAIYMLLFTRPSWRLLVLSVILTTSFWFMYLGMLPYACAPAGLFAICLLVRRELSLKNFLTIGIGLSLGLVAVNIGQWRSMRAVLQGWQNVIGQTLQGQYFLDFLTEQFFPIFFGITSYPLNASTLTWFFGDTWLYASMICALAIGIAWGLTALDWATRLHDKRPAVLGACALTVYGVVWFIYTFDRQYGYAVFKMASWLQFLLVTGFAIGLHRLWTAATHTTGRRRRITLRSCAMIAAILVVGGNAATSIEYGIKSLGRRGEGAYIVNNFQMSGNRDYFDLRNLRRITGSSGSIGLVFGDSIQNFWASYYLDDIPHSIISHTSMPGDDENLPDVVTRRVIDYYGNELHDENPLFHGESDAYLLMANEDHMNYDIIDQELPAPIWRNRTFRLLRATEVRDLLFTGRGYYRLELPEPRDAFWWPKKSRWVSRGGEIYLMHVSAPGQPYRLSFDVLVGYGVDRADRTLELWNNAQKFDELTVSGNGRVITAPFYPIKGVNRIVFRAKEIARPVPRKLSLWNAHIPADYRALNFATAGIRLHRAARPGPRPALGQEVNARDILRQSLAFDGLELNGWVRERGEVSFVRPPGAASVTIQFEVPGVREIRFPTSVTIGTDGASRTIELKQPGLATATLPLAQQLNDVVIIRIRPAQAFVPSWYQAKIRDGEIWLRPVIQSIQLKSIQFCSLQPHAPLPEVTAVQTRAVEPGRK